MKDFFTAFSLEQISISINFLLMLFLFVLITINASKVKKLKVRYNRFMEGLSDRSIEQLVDTCLDELKNLKDRNRGIENKINYIERNVLQCVQKVGIVRFNAFENVGSDLSFSIALLDSYDNGIIISSIYSRENSTTYAKPVVGGKSKYALSAEEMQVLDIAKKTYNERLYIPENNDKIQSSTHRV